MASKRVLIGVSEKGFWIEELVKPIDRLKAAGYSYDFVVGTGKTLPFPDPASLDATYVDPPLNRPVTAPDLAERGRGTDWEEVFKDRIALTDILPVRPYLNVEGHYLSNLEQYYIDRQKCWDEIVPKYDALLLVGGGGAAIDMANNNRLHDLILGFYYADKPIAAECYTVTSLAFSRELDTRTSILRNRHVTGHTMEYDYTSGWATWTGTEFYSFEAPPYALEYILRDTVQPDGQFHGNVGRPTSVIVDWPFLTSRSVESSDECGVVLVKMLTEGVRRYGW